MEKKTKEITELRVRTDRRENKCTKSVRVNDRKRAQGYRLFDADIELIAICGRNFYFHRMILLLLIDVMN